MTAPLAPPENSAEDSDQEMMDFLDSLEDEGTPAAGQAVENRKATTTISTNALAPHSMTAQETRARGRHASRTSAIAVPPHVETGTGSSRLASATVLAAPSTPPNRRITTGDNCPGAPRHRDPRLEFEDRGDNDENAVQGAILRYESDSSENEPDPACGVCSRRTATINLHGCRHVLCRTCTARHYLVTAGDEFQWPNGMKCPFCRRFVTTIHEKNRWNSEDLPSWVVFWYREAQARMMVTRTRWVHPQRVWFVRTWQMRLRNH